MLSFDLILKTFHIMTGLWGKLLSLIPLLSVSPQMHWAHGTRGFSLIVASGQWVLWFHKGPWLCASYCPLVFGKSPGRPGSCYTSWHPMPPSLPFFQPRQCCEGQSGLGDTA
jgi:hypothetical protein